MDGPPSFTSVVARPDVQFSDTSYNNEHGPPSVGSVAMAQLQLSDTSYNNYSNSNVQATSIGSLAMGLLQLSDQLTETSYSNEKAPSIGSLVMGYEKGISKSASDGFSYHMRPPSLTDVAGRDGSHSGPGPMEIYSNSASMSEDNDDDASTIDPDADLSYLDEKLQHALGHFLNDFERGISAENLGSKFGGYGSFVGPGSMELDSHSASMFEDNNGDASTNDPDADLSYIDEKLQRVLGHFRKDFERGISAEHLGKLKDVTNCW
ncbi:hypothetical protein HanRHA438_Chr02g0056131 [Helianthus annuus]|uniref:Uncharacterized protein n=1 Tax=Helianthus annuus TaxID=4232 RepID=A0A251UN14_HELAN|nr:uncharacterized protein LOC110939922 [Helianthus annuus]KAF5817572.1 hypothetical protein HanXRQr2_Chr02g0054611 [Helianthus annuus]KAJ0939000.1 hypothetical protein HanRHA438_Chr02g0056131 [Helianthus annuus]